MRTPLDDLGERGDQDENCAGAPEARLTLRAMDPILAVGAVKAGSDAMIRGAPAAAPIVTDASASGAIEPYRVNSPAKSRRGSRHDATKTHNCTETGAEIFSGY